MNFARYIKHKDIRLKVDPADIVSTKQFLRDKRSFLKDNMWYVYPIGESVTGKSVDIICPYCGKIHRHSNKAGHRVSHCFGDDPGYIIVIEGACD